MIPTSKTQVDRLGNRLRTGKIQEEDLRQLDAYRRSFAEAYEEVVTVVREATQLEPTGRPAKSTSSIIEKLRRETIRLSQMQDIAGCRLVVQDVRAQDAAVERLKIALSGAVVVDRRKEPSYGYRAVHIIATAHDKPIEIQVRTELQHVWAQLSEKLSDVFDPAIKYGGSGQGLGGTLVGLSAVVGRVEHLELLALDLKGKLSQLKQDHLEFMPQPLALLDVEGELSELRRGLRRDLEALIARMPIRRGEG